MKKLFLMFAFATLAVSCGTKTEDSSTQDSTAVISVDSIATTAPSDSTASDTCSKACSDTCKNKEIVK
jgi:hypothetical protein